jgi:hypothetical protein
VSECVCVCVCVCVGGVIDLDLGCNHLGDEGMTALAQVCRTCSLTNVFPTKMLHLFRQCWSSRPLLPIC